MKQVSPFYNENLVEHRFTLNHNTLASDCQNRESGKPKAKIFRRMATDKQNEKEHGAVH